MIDDLEKFKNNVSKQNLACDGAKFSENQTQILSHISDTKLKNPDKNPVKDFNNIGANKNFSQNGENPAFLSEQLINYLGNKRALLPQICAVLEQIKRDLGAKKISFADVFSGSGAVARAAKAHSHLILANDLEGYSRTINSCYLSNFTPELGEKIDAFYEQICAKFAPKESFISELYAPKNDAHIKKNERVFYSRQNALIIGGIRAAIDEIPPEFRHFFIAPLLSEASIHSNTGGVFKGFYKGKNGVGKFGGEGANALSRILGKISLKKPVFSRFASEFATFSLDAREFARTAQMVDVAYFDPPYNQHPYGSNYFMLNLINDFRAPNSADLSEISGIPRDWNRSNYNKKAHAAQEFFALLSEFRAKFLVISFNSEGFISRDEFLKNLTKIGRINLVEIRYPTYRASRNLRERDLYVTEFIYIVKKD